MDQWWDLWRQWVFWSNNQDLVTTSHVSRVSSHDSTCDGIIPSKVRGPITALCSLSLCRLFNAVYGHSLNIQFMGNSLDSFTPSWPSLAHTHGGINIKFIIVRSEKRWLTDIQREKTFSRKSVLMIFVILGTPHLIQVCTCRPALLYDIKLNVNSKYYGYDALFNLLKQLFTILRKPDLSRLHCDTGSVKRKDKVVSSF